MVAHGEPEHRAVRRSRRGRTATRPKSQATILADCASPLLFIDEAAATGLKRPPARGLDENNEYYERRPMARVKIAYLGGGSSRAPGTMASFIHHGAEFDGSEFVLIDLDPDHLEITRRMATRMAQGGRPRHHGDRHHRPAPRAWPDVDSRAVQLPPAGSRRARSTSGSRSSTA